jgi:hypothetical protein
MGRDLMTEEKAINAPAPAPPKKIVKRSVQEEPFSLEQGPGGGNAFVIWMASIADMFTAWGTNVKQRDKQLRDWWPTESVLSGAIYTVTASNAGFRWKLTGPDLTAHRTQEILEQADMGKGWDNLIKKLSVDLYTQDNGAFIEVIRDGNSPNAPTIGIAHLEAYKCTRTGDLETPVIYEDRHGVLHKMPWYSVIPLEEFPSSIEEMHGVQYCAVTRVLRMAQIMRDIAIYRGEKVGGRFSEAIHVVGGVSQKDIDTIRDRMQEKADNRGLGRYLEPIVLASLDPQTAPSSVTLSMKSLPENFTLDDELRWYISIIALGLGRDYQDFAPLPRGGLGSGAQSEILHLKTRGKGPATFMDLITHAINTWVTPKSVTFEFDVQDIEAEIKESEAKKNRAEARAARIREGEIGPIIARQIAQDEGDLDPKYLELMGESDLTPDMLLEEGEKPGRKPTAPIEETEESLETEEPEEKARREVGPRFPFGLFQKK